MLRMLEALWASASYGEMPPLQRYTEEEESETTIECAPPTWPSTLSAEDAFELAQEAIKAKDFDAAKGYMQYVNQRAMGR